MTRTFANFLSQLDAARAFPCDLDTSGQKALFNEALEELINDGRWKGTESILSILVTNTGLLTLPRYWQTLLGVKVGPFVRDLAGIWYSFLPGTSTFSQEWTSPTAQDRGDGFSVFKQPSAPAQLRVACTGSEGKTVEVHGSDLNGNEIWNGAQRGIVLTIGAAKTGSEFQTIRDVIKPVTSAQASLYACYEDGSEEVIGLYEPGETVPDYRQYFVPEASAEITSNTTTCVTAFCKRRHVDMVADNDVVPIAHFGALKNALTALHYRSEGEETRADMHMTTAIDLLNKQLLAMHPPTELGAMRVWAKQTAADGLHSMR